MGKNQLSTKGLLEKDILDNFLVYPDGDTDLVAMRDELEYDYQRQIEALEREKETYRSKTVKGNIYWYQYIDEYKYLGKPDPRIAVDQKIANLREKAKTALLDFNSLVLVEVNHTPILYKKILQHPGFTAEKEVIPVLELLSRIHAALENVPDNSQEELF